ncbi:hypothetical protein GCM10020218_001170 [Dactylosporangium vinaceum]
MTSDGEWPASIPFSSGGSIAGRIAMLGGTLALTRDEVTFTPLVGLGRVRRFGLGDLRSVEPAGERPARLRITARDGRTIVLMVSSHRRTPVWSRDNSARDEAIAAITKRAADPRLR